MTLNKINSDMTRGNLWLQMLVFSLPLIFCNLLQVLFNMADLAVVGRFSGSLALGSVGSTSMIVNLFVGFLIGEAGGINVLVAREKGAGNGSKAGKTVHTAFALSVIIGVSLAAVGFVLTRPVLVAMNTKSELLEGAVTYLRIYMLGMPAMAIFNFGNAVLNAVGETKKPLYYLTTAGITNVALNLVFVIVFDLSTLGVALATVISKYLSAVLIISYLVRVKDEDIRLKWNSIRLDKERAKALIGICIPSGLQNAIFFLANIFVQVGVNTFDAVMVSGNAAATNADGLVYDVMAAIYTAISSFMGQNFGAGNRKRVIKSYYIGMIYSIGAGLVLGVGLYAFGEQFLSLFAKEKDVIAAGMEKLAVMGLTYWISGFMDGTIAACRGLGRSVVPMYIVFAGSCAFRLIWIFTVFRYFGTIESLYLLYSASWTLTAIFEIIYFVRIYRYECKSGALCR